MLNLSEIYVPDSKDGIVSGARVYDFYETLRASGYPMRTEKIDYANDLNAYDLTPDIKRCKGLIKAVENDNAAHGQFLSGILVSFDLTFTVKAWTEAERYKFVFFISSQSSMHRISKFDLDTCFDDHVDWRCKAVIRELVNKYNDETDPEKKKEIYLKLLYSCPTGLKLTARVTTNYRCLRNIYRQRKAHRLPEWRTFCKWMELLPSAEDFIIN